ncbi:MAG: hypothetical protein AAF558_07200 [Verrucomicrobiota bacterium]
MKFQTPLFICFISYLMFSAFALAQESQPSGNYRVMPVFPGEELPDQTPTGDRSEIVIQPDGSVRVEGEAVLPQEENLVEVRPAIPVEEIESEVIADFGGMDGMPTDPTKPVQVEIISPIDKEILKSQAVDAFFTIKNYKLGPEDSNGNRIHYILDNREPQVVYDSIRPLSFKNLSQGGHTLRIYAVRPDGKMFRNPEAFAMVHFYVGRKDFQNYTDAKRPFLTVNMPKGDAITTDDDGKIVFDYMMHNVGPSDGFEVRYKLGSYEGFLGEQGPVYWSNIATGKHKLSVELLKSGRQPVIGPFNRISRQFSVSKVMRAQPIIEEDTVIQESLGSSEGESL